ncbi:hypothetical protein HY837_05990, partial [archaeon]|nr:hypothetical protein [archaeon]
MEIPFINIAAKNNYEFGFKLGSALSERINKRIETNKKMYRRNGVNYFYSLVDEEKKFLPGMKKYFPNLLIEAQAMSEGAGVDFDEILVRLCGEELLSFSVPKCTSISVKTTTGDVLLGHNEDWLSEY